MTPRRVRYVGLGVAVLALAVALGSLVRPGTRIDGELALLVDEFGLEPLTPASPHSPELAELGRLLFFDPVLSGNMDTSCATCHHPVAHTGDDLSLPIGTAGTGLAGARVLGDGRAFVPRNAPDVFNRGDAAWSTMFWDMRVADDPEGGFISPAGELLPEELANVLAVQAMFPVTSRDEMRGRAGDIAADGAANELALIDDADLTGVWDALMARLMALPEYRELFAAAFPEVSPTDIGFEHAATAIAAFEADAFGFVRTPWDRYLAGDTAALSDDAKQGAVLFYGTAGCASCHSGSLLTDQLAHNLAAPQIGPGKGEEAPMDYGRFRETGDPADLYAFRTPSLRNVELTGPWFHDGAYTSLQAVIRHHLDPAAALQSYDESQLRSDVAAFAGFDAAWVDEALERLDPELRVERELSDEEIDQLEAFLLALTDPAARDLEGVIPERVPSGLIVDR